MHDDIVLKRIYLLKWQQIKLLCISARDYLALREITLDV